MKQETKNNALELKCKKSIAERHSLMMLLLNPRLDAVPNKVPPANDLADRKDKISFKTVYADPCDAIEVELLDVLHICILPDGSHRILKLYGGWKSETFLMVDLLCEFSGDLCLVDDGLGEGSKLAYITLCGQSSFFLNGSDLVNSDSGGKADTCRKNFSGCSGYL